MKKLLAFVLFLILSFSLVSSCAWAEDNTESEFNRILLTKGSLIIKEFIDFKEIGDTGVMLQIATLTNPAENTKYKALRLEWSYYNSKYDYGDAVGVLDADEVASVISTLEFIKNNLSSMKDYTEIIYETNGGLEIGAYKSSSSSKLYLSNSSNQTDFLDVSTISTFISVLKEAQKLLID